MDTHQQPDAAPRQLQEVDVARIDPASGRRTRTLASLMPLLALAAVLILLLLLALAHSSPHSHTTQAAPDHTRIHRRHRRRMRRVAHRTARQRRTAIITCQACEISSASPDRQQTQTAPPPATPVTSAPQSYAGSPAESLSSAEEEFGFEQ